MSETGAKGLGGLPGAVEVVVIGGGIVGCATAYYLAKRGVPVALLEKGRIGGEQSSRNWGWVRKQGRDPLEIPAAIEALRLWEGLEAELGEDLGWHRGGTLYLGESEAQMAGYEAWLEHAKLFQLDSKMLSPAETDAILGQDARRWTGALYTPSDGRAEPGKAAPAIARGAERLGAQVIANCAVRTVETSGGKVSGVATERGTIACQAVVCAAGAWSRKFALNLGIDIPQMRVKASALRTKPAPLVTQANVWSSAVGFRRRQDGGYTLAQGGAVTFDLVPDLLRWGRAFWPAYRMQRKTLRLRVSSTFFKELLAPKRWDAGRASPFEADRVLDPDPDDAVLRGALKAAGRVFPELGPLEMAESWAGVIEATPDEIPLWCEVDQPGGFYLATGLSGHGFGMGPGAGLLLSELVMDGKARVDMTPFRLSRFFEGTKPKPFSTH